MKIDTDKLLTPEQAGERIGANKRAVYRAIRRASEAGEEVVVVLFGRSLVPVEKIEVLRRYYFPYYSEAHQSMVKKWGSAGGKQKKLNSARDESSSRGTSHKAAEAQKSE